MCVCVCDVCDVCDVCGVCVCVCVCVCASAHVLYVSDFPSDLNLRCSESRPSTFRTRGHSTLKNTQNKQWKVNVQLELCLSPLMREKSGDFCVTGVCTANELTAAGQCCPSGKSL